MVAGESRLQVTDANTLNRTRPDVEGIGGKDGGEGGGKYQFDVIEQISALYAFSSRTRSAVLYLEDGIGGKSVARRTPYAEVVDGDIA